MARFSSGNAGSTGQRLGIAAVLLGDPAVVMLDEPVNGLDPEGVLWVRNLLAGLAAEGRTVMLLSHLMSETAIIATHLFIMGRGRLLADTTVDTLVRQSSGAVRVASTDAGRLRTLLTGPQVTISSTTAGELTATGLSAREIGDTANRHHMPLYELTSQSDSPEEAFMELTRDSVEFNAAVPSSRKAA